MKLSSAQQLRDPPSISTLSLSENYAEIKCNRDPELPATNDNYTPNFVKLTPRSDTTSQQSFQQQLNQIQDDIKELKTAILKIVDVCTNLSTQLSAISQTVISQENKIDQTADDLSEFYQHWIEEKGTAIQEDQCRIILNRISTTWQDKLNDRKLSYWHYLQNENKAKLYEKWITESPLYLPLKFRPKIINNETPTATQKRVSIARERYKGDIEVMKSYAASHNETFSQIDDEMDGIISSHTQSPAHYKILKKWWLEDAIRNAQMSQQLWDKKQNFLESLRTKDLEKAPDDCLLKSKEITRRPHPLPRRDFKQRNRAGNSTEVF